MNVKKLLLWVFLIFLVFWLFKRPESLAHAVGSIWDFLAELLSQMLRFVTKL